MVEVYGFSNFEDMLAKMQQLTNEANKGLATQQAMVTYGSHWVRFYDIKERVVIFSKVMTEAEYAVDEADAGADPDEIAFGLQHIKDRQANGSVYGMAYSVLVPTGEPGNTHRSELWPIEERLFNAARSVGWDIDRLPEAEQLMLEEAYIALRGHVKAREERGEG